MACPACGSHVTVLLGILGRLAWFRCRYCGIDYSMPADEVNTDVE